MQKLLRILTVVFLATFSLKSQAQPGGGMCTSPIVTAAIPDSNKVTLNWIYNSLTTVPVTFTVEYTAAPATNSSTWTTAQATASPYIANGLTKCKNYVFRVKTNCSATSSSAWSSPFPAKTTGCVFVAPCTAPAFTTVTSDSTSATLAWTAGAAGTTYVVEYTASPVTNTSAWTAVNSSTNGATITGLTACKGYVFRVKSVCSATSSSGWSALRDTKTKGCVVNTPCNAPVITIVTPDTNKVTITWSAGGVANAAYILEYTASPASATSTWTAVNSATNTAVVAGLTACKGYVFRVKAVCSATTSSAWSSVRDTKTKGCVVNTPCNAPVITAVVMDTTKATINWTSSNAVGASFILEYTTAPSSSSSIWTAVNSSTTSATITGLTACKSYIFRVKTVCSAITSSAWSAGRDGKTKGCVVVVPCSTPVITTVVSDTTKATINWTSTNATGASFIVEYTTSPVNNNSTWTAVNSSTTSATITGLTACTGYVFRVKAACSATASSGWSAGRDTKTKGCVVVVPCSTPIITTVVSDTTKATINWTSTNAAGGSFIVEYTTSPASTTSTWTAVNSSTTSATITGLTACTGYIFRVKAVCSAIASSGWSSLRDTKTKGCVVVVPCHVPNITSLIADTTKVNLSWGNSGTVGAPSYTVEYTAVPLTPTSVWTSTTVTTTSTTVTGLTACTEYFFRVKANCSATSSSAWSLRDVKTKGCAVSACKTPTNLQNIATNTSVVLSWVGTASYFQVRIKSIKNMNAAWTIIDSIAANTLTRAVGSCNRYIWQVRSKCANGTWTSWSATKGFATLGCTSAQSLIVSPNPSSHLNLGYLLENEGKVSFDIVNVQGSVIKNIEVGQQFAGENQFSVDELELQTGIYFIIMKVDGIQQQIQRWIKE